MSDSSESFHQEAHEHQDPRIGKIFGARGQLQMLLMNRWGGGDDAKALEWSDAYRRAFREVFPPHTEPGENKFLVLEKMHAFVHSDGDRVLAEVQASLDEYLREHPEARVDTVSN